MLCFMLNPSPCMNHHSDTSSRERVPYCVYSTGLPVCMSIHLCEEATGGNNNNMMMLRNVR